MGWGRTLFLGDIGNRLDIEDTERDIDGLRRQLTSARSKDLSRDQRLTRLESENAELKLYLAALLRLLRQKGTVTDDELRSMVHAIDAEDGQIDGTASGEVF